MQRNEIISSILEDMNLTKRAMQSYMHQILSNISISPAQLEMLYIIHNLQPVTSKTLAVDRQLTPGAISQLTDVLVQQNLILREPDATDRRTHTLVTTKNGQKLLHTIQKRRNELFKRAMQNFTENELEVWLRIQRKIISELENEKTDMMHKGTSK